jgi:EAL domain-containing protein (putative c-di-GMP-specific phosphodiesterase class I)
MSDVHVSGLPLIESAFQPILSLAHGLPIGYEALLRATLGDSGTLCAPEAAFALARAKGCYGEFERACVRHHVQRFQGMDDGESVLFLNVHPDLLVHPEHGPGLAADLLASGTAPSRVVIEILEAQGAMNGLAEAVERLREQGCLIALDDFGAGLTNLGRVWDLRPDVVKLDRELICKAASSYRNARSLLRLVDLLHDIGTFIVVEGVETEEQARLSLDCDADFVQGYYFARPSPRIAAPSERSPARLLETRLASAHKLRHAADLDELVPYRQAFRRAMDAFCAGRDLAECSAHFLHLEWAARVFLLDDSGMQVGENVESDRHAEWRNRGPFPLLSRRAGAQWSKRPYFRHAVLHSGQIAVSEPYMSSSSKTLSVTLSVHVRRGGRGFVLCGDVLFEGLSRQLR